MTFGSVVTLPGLVVPPERPVIRVRDLCSIEEARVVRALEWGSAHARKVDELAKDVRLTSRQFQHVMDHLLFEHAVPVGTSMRRPFGNYLIDSPQDLEDTVTLYTRRGLHSLAKASGLKRQSLRRYLSHVQTHLHLFEAER